MASAQYGRWSGASSAASISAFMPSPVQALPFTALTMSVGDLLASPFYIEAPYLVRSHTSPVQIRTMKQRKPPIRVIAPGKVFRPDKPDAGRGGIAAEALLLQQPPSDRHRHQGDDAGDGEADQRTGDERRRPHPDEVIVSG